MKITQPVRPERVEGRELDSSNRQSGLDPGSACVRRAITCRSDLRVKFCPRAGVRTWKR